MVLFSDKRSSGKILPKKDPGPSRLGPTYLIVTIKYTLCDILCVCLFLFFNHLPILQAF